MLEKQSEQEKKINLLIYLYEIDIIDLNNNFVMNCRWLSLRKVNSYFFIFIIIIIVFIEI